VEPLSRREFVIAAGAALVVPSRLVTPGATSPALRELEPSLRLGWSVPRVKRDYAAWPGLQLPAYAGVFYLRRKVVHAARRHLAAGRCDALMVNWRLVTRGLVDAVREEGGELYVWTVDDARRIRSLEALGVTGVITNDPRLFTTG
jgi:glycerophosphoryl diester phosphodiesterase